MPHVFFQYYQDKTPGTLFLLLNNFLSIMPSTPDIIRLASTAPDTTGFTLSVKFPKNSIAINSTPPKSVEAWIILITYFIPISPFKATTTLF